MPCTNASTAERSTAASGLPPNHANQSAAENEEKGEQMGMDLATRIMMAALDTCGVKPERLR